MCDLTRKKLAQFNDSQIALMTTEEIRLAINNGAPNYMAVQSMALELAKRLEELEPSLDIPEAA